MEDLCLTLRIREVEVRAKELEVQAMHLRVKALASQHLFPLPPHLSQVALTHPQLLQQALTSPNMLH